MAAIVAWMSERWVTDDDLRDAAMRLVRLMPGFRLPTAYTVGLVEVDRLRFGYLNGAGGTHHLPGAVLAHVCGHRTGTATYELNAVEFGRRSNS